MNETIIRPLSDNAGEVAAVADWIYEEWGSKVPGRTRATAREKVRQALGPDDLPLTLVCRIGGELAGTASIDLDDMSSHPELGPWLASVYVAPAFRRRGVATALCGRIAEEFRRLDIRTAYLFTPDQEGLYRRLGWRVMAREQYRGEQVALMKLDLG